jgi:hypothetical protein
MLAIAYLRMSKLKNLPQNPVQPAARYDLLFTVLAVHFH